jgi:hypothetical protein
MAEHEVPDLHDVADTIQQAREAEDELLHTMPNAIQPDDDAYEGMSGPTEGDVQEVDDRERSDDERQAEAPERTPTEQVEDDVVEGSAPPTDEDAGGERRDNVDEAYADGRVVEDDSAPPADPDHR